MDADRICEVYRARLAALDAAASESHTLVLPPNVLAGLATLRAAEGTSGPDGYGALFGYGIIPGRTFADFSDHPRLKFSFKQSDGTINYTTAAGAYQEIVPTFERLSAKLGTTDFTPATQDYHAIELIREQGALEDLVQGRIVPFVEKCGAIWASLPSSRYPQPRRSMAFIASAFEGNGGLIA